MNRRERRRLARSERGRERRWRCDFCDCLIEQRVKMTHSSGLVLFACVSCFNRVLPLPGDSLLSEGIF